MNVSGRITGGDRRSKQKGLDFIRTVDHDFQMSDDQDAVKAVFVVLSKLKVLRDDEGELPTVERLEDLEKALGVLASTCSGEERSELVEWAGKVESTRGEIESVSSDIRKKIAGLYGPMEAMILDFLISRVPEEKREEVQERLAKIMAGSDDAGPSTVFGLDGESSPRSGLEDKLKMLEEDGPSSGLDRYIDEGQG